MGNTDSNVQIIPFYAHPHVHTVINDDTWYDETTKQSEPVNSSDKPFTTMIITGADTGIDNKFVRLSDATVKEALFGKGNYSKYGQASIQADVLFNGNTNVWLCRALPDNATYANIVYLMHFRKGNILDDLGQETGKKRLEVKLSLAYANKPYLANGARTDEDIEGFAESLASETADPNNGYMVLPIAYGRSVGHGKYGNMYSMGIERDYDAEKEYGVKMYLFNLLTNSNVTKVTNQFSGSLYQVSRDNVSTLIDDVIDQYAEGSAPVFIHSFEENLQIIYDLYREIVTENMRYVDASGNNAEDAKELQEALAITIEQFDPLFGIKMDSRTNEQIPYYRNYTTKSTGAYVSPNFEVPNEEGATKPMNISDWNTAEVGSTVLVVADPLKDGRRILYTVVSIDPETGNIVYDEGVTTEIDADQYDGVNISSSVGQMLSGGHDGDFQEITVDGKTRAPKPSEMKLLLSREYVKILRGRKDRRILSHARINLDFIFDANYNMVTDDTLEIDGSINPLYNGSTVITDKDYQSLSVLAKNGTTPYDNSDLNVKQALYDLVRFRNVNGMTINQDDQGAGCSLYLDCGLVGLKNIGVNQELEAIIDSMAKFTGRACSIDLGYYEIFDPMTSRRIKVTATYKIAKDLVPHMMVNGINKPYTNTFAQLISIQRDSTLQSAGEFIRDSFNPTLDLIDWDVKEKLYKQRINYWLTDEEGRIVYRATQNTCQTDASALLEENNVRVLNTLKKQLEKACRGYGYNWNEPEVRKSYTKAQTEVFRPWIGTIVQDLSIKFDANEWEQKRMIMHCYVEVKFRDIVKRIILEINIKRLTYSEGGE